MCPLRPGIGVRLHPGPAKAHVIRPRPQSPASPAGEQPSTPTIPGLVQRGASVHARNPRPRPKGSNHRPPQSSASPEGLTSPGVEQPPRTARERGGGDRGPRTAITTREDRQSRKWSVAALRARPGIAEVVGCSPSGEAGDCGRGPMLPFGRGRGLRAWTDHVGFRWPGVKANANPRSERLRWPHPRFVNSSRLLSSRRSPAGASTTTLRTRLRYPSCRSAAKSASGRSRTSP
ncbi:MAG: hypothetical protein JWM10_1620 [Myxococcaceae bacterium]|nr:hypothetical protein [Myxococcaceae bacterium]